MTRGIEEYAALLGRKLFGCDSRSKSNSLSFPGIQISDDEVQVKLFRHHTSGPGRLEVIRNSHHRQQSLRDLHDNELLTGVSDFSVE